MTNISQVTALDDQSLRRGGFQARLQGDVIYIPPQGNRLYLQNGNSVLYADFTNSVSEFKSGQRVEVAGPVKVGWLVPRILSTEIKLLEGGTLPEPLRADVTRLAAGEHAMRFVTVHGVVRDMMMDGPYLLLLVTERGVAYRVHSPLPAGTGLPRQWLDAEIEARGMARPISDNFGNAFGFLLYQNNTNLITIVRPGGTNHFDRPLLSIAQATALRTGTPQRVKIAGTVLAHTPAGVLFVEDATGVMRVQLLSLLPHTQSEGQRLEHESQASVTPGERVEVIGARQDGYFLTPSLEDGEFRRAGQGSLAKAPKVSAGELQAGAHMGRLVTVRAQLLDQRAWTVLNVQHRSLILQDGEQIFQARWESDAAAEWNLHPNQYVVVTGVNDVEAGEMKAARTFQLLLRSPADVIATTPPPWWAAREIRRLVTVLGIGLVVAGAWWLVQRRQLRRLRASEARFRALIEHSFDVTLVLNADGTMRYISPSATRLLGKRAEGGTLMKTGFAELVHPEDLPRIMKAHNEVLQKPGDSRVVSGYRILAADGSIRHAEAIGTNCLHVPGVEGVVVNVRDVTERLLADAAARQSEVVTRTINYFATSLLERYTEEDILWDLAKNCISQLEFVDCVIYVVDRERQVLVQKAALGPKSPVGREIVNPIVIPIGEGIVGSVAATGKAELINDTSQDPRYIVDDQRRFSEITVPIIANGQVVGIIDSEHPQKNFFTDDHLKMLTAIASLCANKLVRVWAEQQLRQSHEQLERRVLERAGELVKANEQLTREISERWRAEKVQRALYAISEAIHGVEDLASLYGRIHEIIGGLMPARNFYIALQDPASGMVSFPYHQDQMDAPPQPRRGHRGMTEYILRTGRAALVDLKELARLESASEYVQTGALPKIWLGVPLISGDGITFGVMAVQDHHQSNVYGPEEKQILSFVAGQTALAIERKRAEYDLRVALAAEKELNQLKSSFVSMVSHEFRTPLEVILSSSNILDRYLDRLPADKRKAQLRAIRKSVHRMNDLIEDVLLLGKLEAGRLACHTAPLELGHFCRRAVAEIESAAGREGIVHLEVEAQNGDAQADEGLLHHILTNLLGNAVKYSPPDCPVELHVSRAGADAQFIVRDRGCGIPKADHGRLFTAFYRGSNVGQTPGSGLGLVIVKRCVDLHGGNIQCDSEEGQGTTFTLTLPLFDGTRLFRRQAAAPN